VALPDSTSITGEPESKQRKILLAYSFIKMFNRTVTPVSLEKIRILVNITYT
jgi:hypothetical protein